MLYTKQEDALAITRYDHVIAVQRKHTEIYIGSRDSMAKLWQWQRSIICGKCKPAHLSDTMHSKVVYTQIGETGHNTIRSVQMTTDATHTPTHSLSCYLESTAWISFSDDEFHWRFFISELLVSEMSAAEIKPSWSLFLDGDGWWRQMAAMHNASCWQRWEMDEFKSCGLPNSLCRPRSKICGRHACSRIAVPSIWTDLMDWWRLRRRRCTSVATLISSRNRNRTQWSHSWNSCSSAQFSAVKRRLTAHAFAMRFVVQLENVVTGDDNN
jgi:hypothetical protein